MGGQGVVLVDGEVGHADGADLAGGVEVAEDLRDVGRVGEHVGSMDLPEVDVVDAESGQRGVDRLAQVRRAGVVRHRRHDAALGCEHHPIAQPRGSGEHGTESLLVLAETRAAVIESVDVGGVDQIHPRIERGLEQQLVGGDVVGCQPPRSVPECTDEGTV